MNSKGAILGAVVLLVVATGASRGSVVGIVASSDTGAGTTELVYYDPSVSDLGDSTNVTGIFSSIAAGDFDEDGAEEIVAARSIFDGCGPGIHEGDLYYYEFQSGSLFFDTSNLCSLFTSVATGNFDGDPASEVVVARYFGKGTVADPFETELRFYQPGESTQYADSMNDDGRFIAVTTGNLDADPQDEFAVAKLEEDGLLGQLESEFWIGEGDGTLVLDLTPNRMYDFTDLAIGRFEKNGESANVMVTSDRRNVALNSKAEGFQAEVAPASITHPFDSTPQRSEGIVGITVGNFDGDIVDDFTVITNHADPPVGFVEIYHGNGISIDETTVEFLAGPSPSQAVAVDTGDLDADGLDEVVVLYDLLDGTSRVITYDIDLDFMLSVLGTGTPFSGTGTDVAVVEACIDVDGDGFGEVGSALCTQGPDTDCDDTDGQSWATPGEALSLQADHDQQTGATTWTWSAPVDSGGTAIVYDTIRSQDAADFLVAAACVESDDGSDTLAEDTAIPSQVFYYLIRAENGCPTPLGSGPLGTGTNGPRVAADCP